MPILMVKNEEYVIRAVLDAALEAFGWALVGDTGSRDATVEIVRALPGVRLVTFGAPDPRALGQARGVLARLASRSTATSCMIRRAWPRSRAMRRRRENAADSPGW